MPGRVIVPVSMSGIFRSCSVVLVLLAQLAAAVGCGGSRPPAPADGAEAGIGQTASRIRADVRVPLNHDGGWAGAVGENATVYADQPFRIRIELESGAGASVAGPFRLQVRRNRAAWTSVPAADFPYPDEIASPRVSIVSTSAYAHGAATEDLIGGSALPFQPGSGVVLDSLTDSWSGVTVHGEWEWPLVIRRFADSAVTNSTGDVFEFRMADSAGRSFAGPAATVTLAVPHRLLGGTFVETPGRLGPWQASNGDLYFVMEPAETWNVLLVVKSGDGGTGWREVDGANRPSTDDLEGFATVMHDEWIHMLHQTTRGVWYHAFRTSDHATAPDTWAVRDEPVALPGAPATQVADLAVRSDGSVVAVYGAVDGMRYRIRAARGTWGNEIAVDGRALSGPQLVLGSDDVVHIAYTGGAPGGGRGVWMRSIRADGTLARAELVATGVGTTEQDVGAVLPLVYLPGDDSIVILYRLATGELWERRIDRAGRASAATRVTAGPVVQNAVDSDQVGADAIGDGADVHVLFIEEATRDLYHTYSAAGGKWQPALPVVRGITGQWVRGARVRRSDGTMVYGFVYDAGSNGGSGMNRYGEVSLRR
jgi:hypothetical protein